MPDQPTAPRSTWFKAKTYGWGWTPSTWQGWAVMLIYAGMILASGYFLLLPRPTTLGWIGYFSTVVAATGLLIFICWKKGEKPSWRWGDRQS